MTFAEESLRNQEASSKVDYKAPILIRAGEIKTALVFFLFDGDPYMSISEVVVGCSKRQIRFLQLAGGDICDLPSACEVILCTGRIYQKPMLVNHSC